MTHLEMGHMLIQRSQYDFVQGICNYHHDCLESLASGPAIEKRAGMSAKKIPKSSKQLDLEAFYLVQACVNISMILSPEKIIFGGPFLIKNNFSQKFVMYIVE